MEGTNTTQNQTETFTEEFRGKPFYRGRGRGRFNKNNANNSYGANRNYYNQKQNYQQNSNYNYKNKTQKKNFGPYQERVDPVTAQAMIMRAEMFILCKYPYLIELNKKNEDIANDITENSKFFVIKSFSEEDVHKAIKYNLWSSTKNGNLTLDNAFKLTKEKGGYVYLFFSCNGSGKFAGVARMKGEVQHDKMFPFWTQDSKWPGIFEIEWVFIKDVPFREFKNVIITMKDGEVKCVSNSRDTQEVPLTEGKTMLSTFSSYLNTNTILEHFEYYDQRQENYERNNPIQYEVAQKN